MPTRWVSSLRMTPRPASLSPLRRSLPSDAMDSRAYPGTGALDHALHPDRFPLWRCAKVSMGAARHHPFAHIAPEGGINFLIYPMGYLAATIFFAAVTITYLMPIIGDDWPQPENSSLPRSPPHQTSCRPATMDGQGSTP
jgi:hypothetical protein